MKTLVIYPGRFQPFHKGHAQVYKWLKNKFGDAVIATSNKVEAPKSPFNFEEKKKMMVLAGVPSSSIKQVVNPYIAREILENYDPSKTILVFAVSQKDMEEDPRFSFKPLKSGKPGYLQPYEGNEKKLKPFGSSQTPKGYVIVTPTFTFDVLGQPATSASELRKQFVSLDTKKQKEFIKDLFGKYDESIQKLMNVKLKAMTSKPKTIKQIRESVNIGLTFARSEMPQIGASASFIKYLKDNGIESKRLKIDPSELKSSQMEFDNIKVEGLRNVRSKNPIVVSNDNHVVDGHHRWLADQLENRPCDAYVCNLPVLELIYQAKCYTSQLKEELTRKQLAPMLDSFVSFASNKLGLQSMPNVRYKTDDDDYNSFAAYNPSKNELSVSTKNRHPMDIFRSVAHELVHHKQNEDGKLGKDIEKEGSTGSDIENEANSEAGKIMRWFAKANPSMFAQTHIVESTNSSAMGGGIRGLGLISGDPSMPEYDEEEESHYMTQNKTDTENLKKEMSKYDDSNDMAHYQNIDMAWNDSPKDQILRSLKNKLQEEIITEGINDPGRLKAVFLAGGPGSGKDFVMNKALVGNGLREINSDTAFEFLMKRHGLDPMMPERERVEREIVRGRAKNITNRKELLSLSGRLGLIVNGTADDLEKIKTVKSELEDLGYDTMMVFVNTSDEVSRQRNFERGLAGVRKVPDGTDEQGNPDGSQNIRKEKWNLAQENMGEFEKLFGKDNFAVIDNTADIRKVSPDQKEKIEADFNRVRRMTMKFVQSPLKNKRGTAWEVRRARYQGTKNYVPPKSGTLAAQQRPTEIPKSNVKPSNEIMAQARRLGLSYYGFGRFGRKVGGKNKVMYHSQNNQLVRVAPMNEEKKMKNPCWKGYRAYGMKKKNGREVPNCVPVEENIDEKFNEYMSEPHNREIGTDSLRKIYAATTPGQTYNVNSVSEDKKNKKKNKQYFEGGFAKNNLPMSDGIGPETTQYRPMSPLGLTFNESIENWINNENTQNKFIEKYGKLAEQKLLEAAIRLEQCGCGHDMIKEKKSIAKIKETFASAPYKSTYGDMGTVQSTGKEELNERGEDSKGLYRSTESGAGLTRKGAKHFGIKTAVTTPPSKLDPKGKAAKRRKSFCARMGGMPGPMKDEKGRPTRKAMSLRRWNCEE